MCVWGRCWKVDSIAWNKGEIMNLTIGVGWPYRLIYCCPEFEWNENLIVFCCCCCWRCFYGLFIGFSTLFRISLSILIYQWLTEFPLRLRLRLCLLLFMLSSISFTLKPDVITNHSLTSCCNRLCKFQLIFRLFYHCKILCLTGTNRQQRKQNRVGDLTFY